MQPSPALRSCRTFLLLLHLVVLIPTFPFPVPITSALPGSRTVSAAQAAYCEKHLSPQLRSCSPQIAGAWLSGGTPGLWVLPESITAWGSPGETVQARSGLQSSPKRGRVISSIFSRAVMAKVLFLKLYCDTREAQEQE